MEKEKNWVRLTEKDIQDGNLGSHNAKLKQIYGVDGKQYPRLVIAIFHHECFNGVKLSCAFKSDADSWWEEYGIPENLIGDAVELMQKYNSELKKLK